MPSLAERKEDLPELCRRFLASGSEGRKRSLSDEAAAALAARPWPGNVRELRNAIERIRVLSDEETIGAAQVARVLGDEKAVEASLVPERYRTLSLSEAKELFERDYLVQKLKDCDYNVSKTAEAIGVYPSGPHAKIKKLGIEP